MFARASTISRRAVFGLGIGSAFASIGASSSLSGSTFAASTSQGAGGPVRRLASLTTPSAEDRRDYATFVRRFVALDGRVVDTYNGGVSHSEGQGWGLLMAVSFNDPATFDRIHGWTRRHLRRPTDSSMPGASSPRRRPRSTISTMRPTATSTSPVRWRERVGYGGAPTSRPKQSRSGKTSSACWSGGVGQRIVLLPGAYGFDRDGGIIVNPSYYAFSMMHEVAQVASVGGLVGARSRRNCA